MEEKGLENWRDYFSKPTGTKDPQEHKWNLPEEFHYNTWIAERTNHYLSEYRNADQPFFLWASFFDPHPSYLVPEPWDTLYNPDELTVPEGRPGEHDGNSPFLRFTQDPEPTLEKYGLKPYQKWIHGLQSHVQDRKSLAKDIAVYYSMVSCMDKYVGRILDRLEELGMADNTLVVFTSDHGHYYGHHNLIAKGPFHYEDGVRVPMLVRWPGKVQADTRSTAIQSLVDLPVSFLQAAGIDRPRFMSGINQLPVWTGQAGSARDHALIENTHEPDQAILRTYVDGRYKLTVYQSLDCGEFFDLDEDPGELHNRWDDPAYAEARSAVMLKFLQAEMKKDVLPMPRTWGA
jgi:arylsulfatase A-like enzyme